MVGPNYPGEMGWAEECTLQFRNESKFSLESHDHLLVKYGYEPSIEQTPNFCPLQAEMK